MHDLNRHRLPLGPGELRRRIQPEEPRAAFHDPHGREDRTRLSSPDPGLQGDRQLVQPSRFEVAQAFGLLAVAGVQLPELLLDVGIRRRIGDVQLSGDLAVARAGDPQVEGFRGPLAARGIFADGTIPGRGPAWFLDRHAFGCYVFGGRRAGMDRTRVLARRLIGRFRP